MAKFPDPPGIDVLKRIEPKIEEISSEVAVARIVFAGGRYPTNWDHFRYFGPTASRFDHHLLNDDDEPCPQDRGIMYLAAGPESIPTCLAEVYQSTRIVDRLSRSPILAGFRLTRPVQLLDLTGPFATAVGASMVIHSGPRPRARRWSMQFYDAYPQIDGILYCSSMYGNRPAIALYERAKDAIPHRPVFHRELDDPAVQQILVETAEKIGYKVS